MLIRGAEMSGGTWDYQDRHMLYLAREVREGSGRCVDEGGELEFPAARRLVADVLEVAADLLRELDFHYCDDTFIPDEEAWIRDARARLAASGGANETAHRVGH
jgi:hypothetical protein